MCGALMARDTVAIEKPACAATSLMVGVIAVVSARVVNVFVERIIGKLCDCPMTRAAWKGVGLVRRRRNGRIASALPG